MTLFQYVAITNLIGVLYLIAKFLGDAVKALERIAKALESRKEEKP